MIAEELKEFADKIQMPLLRRALALRDTTEEYLVMECLPFVVCRMFEQKFGDRIIATMAYNDEILQGAPTRGCQYRKMWVGITSAEDPNNGIFFIDVNNIEREVPKYWDPATQVSVFWDVLENDGKVVVPHSPFYQYYESSRYHDKGYTIGMLEKNSRDQYMLRPLNTENLPHTASYTSFDTFGYFIICSIEQTRMIDSIVEQYQYLIHT